jgi:putative endonuclease
MYLYFVYILKCSDNSYYTGITNDLERRLNEHIHGLNSNCYKITRRPLSLAFQKEFDDVLQAIYFEKKLKGWSRLKKEALINSEFERLQILAECRNATHYKYNPGKDE